MTTSRRSNPDQYLQKVGNTYYARVRVPRTLEKFVGQSHVRRSLQTGSRAEANLKKHAAVSIIKAELAELRKAPPQEGSLSFAEARAIREQLEQLRAADDYEQAATIESVAVDRAEALEALYGHEKALQWYRKATTTGETLKELQERWLSSSDYKESTKAGHRKALQEVLDFVKSEEARPSDVTLKVALSFIDHELTQRGLAYNTIRDRLASLGGFWAWMASRGAVPRGTNPWRGHKISKKQNKGSRPQRRAYTEAEVLALLEGTAKARRWPTYSYLPDLTILGLFTGAREEELCSLTAAKVERAGKGRYVLSITDAKTKAGIRYVGITHAAPVAVLERRVKNKKPGEQVFPELKPGGMDKKYNSSAVRAFGRYRRACGVPDGADFHSFRRNVITVLEAAGVGQVPINRFVGHKVGTLALDGYSAGGSKALSLEVAEKVRYSSKVERLAEQTARR
jgi:site-specific recombinase XerD